MTPPEADQPSTSGNNPASSWSPSTPPAREWQSHWDDVLPELEELARCVLLAFRTVARLRLPRLTGVHQATQTPARCGNHACKPIGRCSPRYRTGSNAEGTVHEDFQILSAQAHISLSTRVDADFGTLGRVTCFRYHVPHSTLSGWHSTATEFCQPC